MREQQAASLEPDGRHWKRKRKSLMSSDAMILKERRQEEQEARTMIDLSTSLRFERVRASMERRPTSLSTGQSGRDERNYQSAGGRCCRCRCRRRHCQRGLSTSNSPLANQVLLFKCFQWRRATEDTLPIGSGPAERSKKEKEAPSETQTTSASSAQAKCQVPTRKRRASEADCQRLMVLDGRQRRRRQQVATGLMECGPRLAQLASWLSVLLLLLLTCANARGQSTNVVQSDPRPTIYSGQVSFALLLSAHSSLGTELTSSASQQLLTTVQMLQEDEDTTTTTTTTLATTTTTTTSIAMGNNLTLDLSAEASEARGHLAPIERRQIFDRSNYQVRRQQQQQPAPKSAKPVPPVDPVCGQVNPGALYAGMGAIWASHQANLVGDSQLSIGTYIYDSCNDLDVGQRQSVRIVSNLNAFQQTTCESPRGSPISVTIAHGDNQLRAIQLLTSFRVPVITTKEHFALEDYSQLSREQRKFLFSTAASSRHLAVGALRFTKRVVARSITSPKLPNRFYKLSSKNGLIVISRNLPAKFIAYLTETIPNHVNYEMLQSSQPIDQVRSVEALESILARSASTSSAASLSPDATSAAASTMSESRLRPAMRPRDKRDSSGGGDSSSSLSDPNDSGNGDESSSSSEQPAEKQRMLSPTILMFITPAEAIDLITRLRNDLAEVSKYYSLIVGTREDISPALKTIFHRGGSRLCSGKAFYTISPVADDIGEFSRYFRDTVQMEGDSSDHPLVCDFAKYQAASKIVNADLDDVTTEPVIKAVWTAAAAFKSVYRRECSSLAAGSGAGAGLDSSPGAQIPSSKHSRQSSSNGNNKSGHAECLVKMNKNMSNLVQKALKRLDVSINSTGLQALDGFRIKFDEMNELMTNKFSIKYINKECEMVEIGQYSGFKDSALRIDEDTLLKSLESALPDAWPVTSAPAGSTAGASSIPSTVATEAGSSSSSSGGATSPGTTSSDANGDDSTMADANSGDGSSGKDDDFSPGGGSTDEKSPGSGGFESALASQEAPKRRRSKATNTQQPVEELRRRVSRLEAEGRRQQRRQQLVAAPIGGATTDGRAPTAGLADGHQTTTSSSSSTTTRLPSSRAPQAQVGATSTGQDEGQQAKGTAMRRLKPFPDGVGATLKDWLPKTQEPATSTTTKSPHLLSVSSLAGTQATVDERAHSSTSSVGDLKMRGTTEAPVVFSTLPESGGNTDLDMPTTRQQASKPGDQSKESQEGGHPRARSLLDTASTNESSDYVTSPSIVQHRQQADTGPNGAHHLSALLQANNISMNQTHRSSGDPLDPAMVRVSYLHDLNSSPTPLLSRAAHQTNYQEGLRAGEQAQADTQKSHGRSKLRSQLKWIYSSWFTLTILAANICGALLTLYVLTFLLMKNCDGSLDRENQGIRSMHLLAIIVVFFGSTLFIVYPTPGLCLLRTSWHNFAMVLIFSSLLLQTMQVRASGSLGLGGRPNRLNQFLTLLFMVGVQVSYELQRWKYESANYVQFVNQYFGSSENGDKKLLVFSSSIASQFNPLNSFNDQVTPVSIQVSEKYQSLLQDYCSQPADDFLQSQMYLCSIICLLIVFSISTRRFGRFASSPKGHHHHIDVKHKLAGPSRKSKSKQQGHHHHHSQSRFADLDALGPSAFSSSLKFASNVAATTPTTTNGSSSAVIGNVFMVTLISAPIYLISVVLHVHGQSFVGHDIIFSLAMVSIAFTTLIGIFMPILHQVNQRFDGLGGAGLLTSAGSSSPTTSSPGDPLRPGTTASLARHAIMSQQTILNNHNGLNPSPSASSAAFAMFPEFAPTGLRRPSSVGGESSSGSRRQFADTKQSRRNMSVNLANLGLSYNGHHHDSFHSTHHDINAARASKHDNDPGLLNLKLNLTPDDELSPMSDYDLYRTSQGGTGHHNNLNNNHHHHHHHHQNQPTSKRSSSSGGEKRLIMLDVDPRCPRHGMAAWSTSNSANCSEDPTHANNNNNNNKTCPSDQQMNYRPDRSQ